MTCVMRAHHMSYSNIIARRVLMAGELPVGIRKEPTDEIAHTSWNNTAIVSPEMSVLGPDVLAVQVRTHRLRGTAEHVPVVLTEIQAALQWRQDILTAMAVEMRAAMR